MYHKRTSNIMACFIAVFSLKIHLKNRIADNLCSCNQVPKFIFGYYEHLTKIFSTNHHQTGLKKSKWLEGYNSKHNGCVVNSVVDFYRGNWLQVQLLENVNQLQLRHAWTQHVIVFRSSTLRKMWKIARCPIAACSVGGPWGNKNKKVMFTLHFFLLIAILEQCIF